MSKKNTRPAKTLSTTGLSLETRFWNCLKKGDVDGLEEILLCREENPETGAITFSIKNNEARSLVNTPNAKKMPPLSYAVSQGIDEQGLHLLLRAGANVDATDGGIERSTALHVACWGEDDIAVALLLRCGANPLVCDAHARTPLHVLVLLNAAALFFYFLETVTNKETEWPKGSLFLEGKEPVFVDAVELLSKKDSAGFTVLHVAVADINSGSDKLLVDLLAHLEKIAKTKSAAVAQLVNMTTASGATALHLLLLCPNCNEGVALRTTERLLQLGANPAAMDSLGRTPISIVIAAHSGGIFAKILDLLFHSLYEKNGERQLEHVFSTHDAENGYSLIHNAIASRNVGAVKVMVEFLKSIDKRNSSQYVQKWLGLALTKKKESVVSMLAEYECDEIAQVLLTANAIEKAEYERYKEENKNKKINADKCDFEQSEDIGEADIYSSGEENKYGFKKANGDFSGFGSTHVGSRMQQARKARSKAFAQRKKQTYGDLDEKYRINFSVKKGMVRALAVIIVIAVVALSLALRSFNLMRKDFFQ